MAVPVTLWNVNKDLLTDAINGKTYKLMLVEEEVDGEVDDNISDLTEVADGNGYSAGGLPVTVTIGQDEAAGYLVGTQPTLSATGGNVGPYRSFVLYEVGSGKLRGAWTEASNTTILSGDTKIFQLNQLTGFVHWGSVDP